MQQDYSSCARNPIMPRVGSGESATLGSMAVYGYDQMDPEVRSQILSKFRHENSTMNSLF